jgi:hypothetical protein
MWIPGRIFAKSPTPAYTVRKPSRGKGSMAIARRSSICRKNTDNKTAVAHFRATVAERKKLMHKDVVQKTNKLPDILLKIYMIMFMFCSLSYPLNHTLPWLSGVCSVYNAYDFAFFAESDLVAGLCITWIPVFMLLVTVCYAVAIRYNNYLPFCVMAGLDLLVSLLFIIFKISSGLYTDLIFMIIGFVIRSLGFLGILFCSRLKKAK